MLITKATLLQASKGQNPGVKCPLPLFLQKVWLHNAAPLFHTANMPPSFMWNYPLLDIFGYSDEQISQMCLCAGWVLFVELQMFSLLLFQRGEIWGDLSHDHASDITFS